MPAAFLQIGQLTKECLSLVSQGRALGGGALPTRKQLPRRPASESDEPDAMAGSVLRDEPGTGGDAIRLALEHGGASIGVVRLTDTSLTSLRLSWSIPRHGKGSAVTLETQLHKGVNLSVEQLRSAINRLRLCLQEIDRTITQQRVTGTPHSPPELVTGLLELLISAKEALTTPQQRVCEQAGLLRDMFKPALPRDVFLDAFLDHGEICVEATVMTECSGFESSHQGLTPRRVGSVFQDDKGRWMEVASLHRAFGVVPHLAQVLKNLNLLVEHTQKMQDKLAVMRDLG